MEEIFITTISLQSAQDLKRLVYMPKGFEMEKNRATCFPIIPVIAETYIPGEEVEVLAIRMDNAGRPDNYDLFLQEMKELGIDEGHIEEISSAENQSEAMGVKLLLTILDKIPWDSLVYADITFGTKPMSAMLMLAMNFIEKLKDVQVEGIFYGMFYGTGDKENPEGLLYDLTVYKHLSNVIDQLSALEVKDPQKILHKLTNL